MSDSGARLVPIDPEAVRWEQQEAERRQEMIALSLVARTAGYRFASELLRVAPSWTEAQLNDFINDLSVFCLAKGLEDLAKSLLKPLPPKE